MTRFSIPGTDVGAVRTGLVALLISLALAGFGAYDYVQQSDAIDDAVTVEATITDTTIDTVSQRRGGVDYKPLATFEYTYQGTSYTGDDIFPATVAPDYGTRSAAEDVLDGYEEGTTVTAYVDPDSPGEAFLEARKSNGPLKLAAIGVVFAVIGGVKIARSLAGS